MPELVKIFLDALRKQSFSLILTVIGLGGLAWWNVEYKREMSAIVTALDAQVKVCSEKREALAVEAAALREKVNILVEQQSDMAVVRRKR